MKARFAIAGLAGVVLLGFGADAFAQGCVLCRTAAAAAAGGAESAKALNRAILVLLLPTLSIFLGIFFWAFRYRNRSLAEQDQAGEDAHASLSPPVPDSPRF